MKTKCLISYMCLLLAFALPATAQEANTLSVPDVTTTPGSTVALSVNLDNASEVVAVQFVLTVPEGFWLNTSEVALSERANGHTVNMQRMEANKYMAMVFSQDNKPFAGETGEILSVPMTAQMGVESGTQQSLSLSDVIICAPDGSNISTGFSTGIINVDYTQVMYLYNGWTWVSGYLCEGLPVEPMFDKGVSRIVSQYDETINDSVMGFVGGIDTLQLGMGYKIKSTSFLDVVYHNKLYSLEKNPIVLAKGWNWIAYPYYERRAIVAVITNAEEGDYIVSQYGFAEYTDGVWEGTIDCFDAGYGYLYKSASDKTLAFDFSKAASCPALNRMAAKAADYGLDVHKYPNTMNITATLDCEGEDYMVYAMSGSELRGLGMIVNGRCLITVYGDTATEISFIVEDKNTGKTYLADETLMFSSDIVGSKKSPYHITVGGVTGIHDINAGNANMAVYSVEGQLINANATKNDVQGLRRGLYIINGKKHLVK